MFKMSVNITFSYYKDLRGRETQKLVNARMLIIGKDVFVGLIGTNIFKLAQSVIFYPMQYFL